jgi:hypothetical protein
VSCHAQTQTQPSCPNRSGIYALNNSSWVELSIAQARKAKVKAAFPFHNSETAIYPGKSSTTQLSRDVLICASGISVGSKFYLARAKAGSKDRQVIVGTISAFGGTFTFGIDSEVDVNQTHNEDGSYSIHADNLSSGQYILFMQQGTSITSIPPAFDFYIQ